MGLLPNAKKSATLNISVSGKRKKWVVDAVPFLHLGGVGVPTVGITDYYRYLGLSTTAGPEHSRALDRLSTHLLQLDKAPLKPQQRMYFLRVHVLPCLHHLLVLDPTTVSRLERLDKLVRKYVRKWLRLPHDTPNSFIHGDLPDGGLGITRWSSFQSYHGRLVSNKAVGKQIVAEQLHQTVDGRGLRFHHLVPCVNNWVGSGTGLLSGHSCIHCIQMRAASLHTAVRAARPWVSRCITSL